MLLHVHDNRFESAARALRLAADGLAPASSVVLGGRCGWSHCATQHGLPTIEFGRMSRGTKLPQTSPP